MLSPPYAKPTRKRQGSSASAHVNGLVHYDQVFPSRTETSHTPLVSAKNATRAPYTGGQSGIFGGQELQTANGSVSSSRNVPACASRH